MNLLRMGAPAQRRRAVGLLIVALAAASGCSTLRVESLAAPNANLNRRNSFSIVERPARIDTVRAAALITPNLIPDNTPNVVLNNTPNVMLNNTIIDQMVRNDIARAFESRGYRMTEDDPDFVVAYYAKAVDMIEIESDLNYRYRYHDCCYVDEFTEGIIVVDVVDARTNKLLWRGSATRRVSDNPRKYATQLGEAVEKIVDRFPIAASAIFVQQ